MRRALLLAMLLVVPLLAGCTGDGYLGGIDEEEQQAGRVERSASLWAAAAPRHVADVDLGGGVLRISGDLPPLSVGVATLRVVPPPRLPHAPEGLTLGGATPVAFALAGAVHAGERGWLVFNASGEPELRAVEGRIAVPDPALRAEGGKLAARLASVGETIVIPMECFGDPAGAPHAGCSEPGEAPFGDRPDALAELHATGFGSFRATGSVEVRALHLVFHPEGGEARALRNATLDAREATLVALSADPGSVTLEVPLAPGEAPTSWRGNLTVSADRPTGTLRLAGEERPFALHNDVTLRLRTGGAFRLASEDGIRFVAQGVEVVDVVAGSPRLEAALRLAPEVVSASGPAGNTTRVNLILAETSHGAHAHVTGYRIDGSVNARYVGWEPFAMTRGLADLLNRTEGPIEAAMLAPFAIALPLVAFGEVFVAVIHAFFPPSLEGRLDAGEARVVTFDLQMPEAPREVEILIEAKNAEPVRATIRLEPSRG